MRNPLQTIEIGGSEREILITPSLFRIAKERDWVIEIQDTSDLIQVAEAYHKMIYCALINAYEVRKWDNPSLELNVTLMDIEVWVIQNPDKFAALLNDFVAILTGKDINEIVKDTEQVKKKSTWLAIIQRLKSF
jgi:hypothetical protein